jgi:hypothetical protein
MAGQLTMGFLALPCRLLLLTLASGLFILVPALTLHFYSWEVLEVGVSGGDNPQQEEFIQPDKQSVLT